MPCLQQCLKIAAAVRDQVDVDPFRNFLSRLIATLAGTTLPS